MTEVPSIIEFSEDISKAEAPVPLPIGEYPFEIRKAEGKAAVATGNKYAAISLFVDADNYPADYTDGDPDGTLLIYRSVSLEDTPPARHNMRKFLEAVGGMVKGAKVDMNTWIGLTGVVGVTHEEYEGEARAVAKKINAA